MMKREVIVPKSSAEDELKEIEKRWRRSSQPTPMPGFPIAVIIFCAAFAFLGEFFGC